MATIRDIDIPWRRDLRPASFRGAEFHIEIITRDNGRRIVIHEFPKKEEPYSEDMGRHAKKFSVRGYCITYPINSAQEAQNPAGSLLYRRDYRLARNALLTELETEGPGLLVLPTLPAMMVVNTGYRISEEKRFGGYCEFDMQFVELGQKPSRPQTTARDNLISQSQTLSRYTVGVMNGRPTIELGGAGSLTGT
jgi:prophage DNA circulation protein